MVKSSTLLQSQQKLMSCVKSAHPDIVKSEHGFVLKSGSDFASRSVCVFNKLNTIEINHKKWMSQNDTHESFDEHSIPQSVMDVSNVFKRPFTPKPSKRASIFHNRRNRKKWIKYSLADVPLTSDATNSAVALQFLNELRMRKEQELEEITPKDGRIIFSKPKKKLDEQNIAELSEKDQIRKASAIQLYHLQEEVHNLNENMKS